VTRLAERPHARYDLDRLVEGLRDPAPRPRAGHCAWRPVNALDARLRAIPAAEYARVLAGVEPDRGGKVRCPFHHPDRTPSLQLYDDGSWYCFGCRRGGSIYQFAGLLWNVGHTRRSPLELRHALAEVFPGDRRVVS
jgi:CHC2 zinc finger